MYQVVYRWYVLVGQIGVSRNKTRFSWDGMGSMLGRARRTSRGIKLACFSFYSEFDGGLPLTLLWEQISSYRDPLFMTKIVTKKAITLHLSVEPSYISRLLCSCDALCNVKSRQQTIQQRKKYNKTGMPPSLPPLLGGEGEGEGRRGGV